MATSWQKYVSENAETLLAIDEKALLQLASMIKDVIEEGRTIWILGNGGSASLSSHAVADFSKTVLGLGGRPARAIALSEMISLQSAFSNDNSFEEGFEKTLRMFAKRRDLVIAISVSGTSPNIVRALETSRTLGIAVSAWVGLKGNGLNDSVDNLLIIPSTDYQVVENAHVAIMHWITKELAK